MSDFSKYIDLRDRVSQLEDTVQMVYDRLLALEAGTLPNLTPAPSSESYCAGDARCGRTDCQHGWSPK